MNSQSQRVISALLITVGMAFIGVCIMAVLSSKEAVRQPADIKPLGFYYTSRVVRLVTSDHSTFCSAVIIGKHHLATAAHCAQAMLPPQLDLGNGVLMFGDLPKIEVRKADDRPTGVYITLKNITEGEPRVDYVLFKGDFLNFEVQPIVKDPYDFYKNAIRDIPVTVCGFPMGHALFCERLKIYGLYGFKIQVIGQMLPGMSGGPGFLDDGTVMSVNSAVEGTTSLLSPIATLPADSTK